LKPKFYYCEDCDSLVILVRESEIVMTCCGQPMIELVPGIAFASQKKHQPIYRVEGKRVFVTFESQSHPMDESHMIEWIALQTKNGLVHKSLSPGRVPETTFALCEDDEVEAVYAYCNVHGLWKA